MLDWNEIAKDLAYTIYQLMEGDTPEGVYENLHELGFVDSNHEWIYEDDY